MAWLTMVLPLATVISALTTTVITLVTTPGAKASLMFAGQQLRAGCFRQHALSGATGDRGRDHLDHARQAIVDHDWAQCESTGVACRV